ncbi:MAG: hypothetical protein RL346_1043 [Verrucomicrobiota bacterium]
MQRPSASLFLDDWIFLPLPVGSLKLAFERTPRGRGFINDNLSKPGQLGREFFPKPTCHDLNGRTLQSFDIIQICVIKLLEERGHRMGNEFVIVDPADLGIDLPLDGDLNLEAVAMHLSALVAFRQTGKGMRGLKSEILGKSCFHRLVEA